MADEIQEALSSLDRLDLLSKQIGNVGAVVRAHAQALRERDSIVQQIEDAKQQLQSALASANQAQADHQAKLQVLEKEFEDAARKGQFDADDHIKSVNAQIANADSKLAALQKQIADTRINLQQAQTDHAQKIKDMQANANAQLAQINKQIAARQAILDQIKATAKQHAQLLQAQGTVS